MLLLLSCTFNITTHWLGINASLSLKFTLNDPLENRQTNPDRPSGIRTCNQHDWPKSVSALNEEASWSAQNNLTTLSSFWNKFTLSVQFPLQFYFKHCSIHENVLHVKVIPIGNKKRFFKKSFTQKQCHSWSFFFFS
jgi:hypothetical protein